MQSNVDRLITYSLGLATDEPGEDDGTGSNVIRLDTDSFSVVEGNLHQEPGDVLDQLILSSFLVEQPQPCLGSWVTKVPSDSCEDMTFHLDKGRLVVCLAAHFRQLLDEGYLVFGLFKLGGGPHGSTSNKLVMFLVDDSFRNVSVDEVDGEVEDFRA
jgi:hypothetical protein